MKYLRMSSQTFLRAFDDVAPGPDNLVSFEPGLSLPRLGQAMRLLKILGSCSGPANGRRTFHQDRYGSLLGSGSVAHADKRL